MSTAELLDAYALAVRRTSRFRTLDNEKRENAARKALQDRIAELEAALVVAANGGG